MKACEKCGIEFPQERLDRHKQLCTGSTNSNPQTNANP